MRNLSEIIEEFASEVNPLEKYEVLMLARLLAEKELTCVQEVAAALEHDSNPFRGKGFFR